MLLKKISSLSDDGCTIDDISRAELMQLFPHRGLALVTSYARICDGAAEFILLFGEFPNYLLGHLWRIPGHWLSEMASQVAGLQAIMQLQQLIGGDVAEYDISMLIKNGDWVDKPLNTNPNSKDPIIAKVVVSTFNLRNKMGLAYYEGEVELSQGKETALYGGLKVVLKRSADNVA